MKICHVIPDFQIGGLQRMVVDLAEVQRAAGHQVGIVAIERGYGPEILPRNPEIIICRVDRKNHAQCFARLLAALWRLKPDLLNTHNIVAHVYGFYLGRRILRIPTVYTKHGVLLPQGRRQAHAVRHADRIVAVSEEVRRLYAAAYPGIAGKIARIPTGLQLAPYEEARTERAASLRAAFGLASSDFVAGTISRLDPVKNIGTLIGAFARLDRAGRLPKLLIVGDGPAKDAWARLAEELAPGRVIFAGPRTDVPDLLALLDLFVLPSDVEGAPMCLLEAMAARVPIVATRVGAVPDMLADEVSALLVPKQDADALFEKMRFALAHPEALRTLAENAGRRVRECFRIEDIARAYIREYERMLEAHGREPAPA
ncbi:MAG: glycosyltransferase family 4 protein [Kiritimatiellae bacterium]|nr:glycosyltransferase family 4 protein [Kiritimatiellia bacterium]